MTFSYVHLFARSQPFRPHSSFAVALPPALFIRSRALARSLILSPYRFALLVICFVLSSAADAADTDAAVVVAAATAAPFVGVVAAAAVAVAVAVAAPLAELVGAPVAPPAPALAFVALISPFPC